MTKYFDFSFSMSGRTRRSTFWYTMLVLGVAYLILFWLSHIIVALFFLLFAVPLVMRRSQDAGLSDAHKYGCIAAVAVLSFVAAEAVLS